MHAFALVTVLTLSATQIAPVPVEDPPATAIEEPSGGVLDAPPPPPAELDAPPPPPAPVAPLPAPDAGVDGEAPASDEIPGLSSFPRGALQVVAGCATLAICGAASAIPIVGWYCIAPINGLLMPAFIATAETAVGDFAGQTRGALLWPIVGAYAAEVIGGALTAGAAITVAALLGGGLAAIIGDGASAADLPTFLATFLGGYAALVATIFGGIALTLVATVVTPAVIYGLTSDFKQPGDSDFRFPGIVSPAHAKPDDGSEASEDDDTEAPEAPAVSMAF